MLFAAPQQVPWEKELGSACAPCHRLSQPMGGEAEAELRPPSSNNLQIKRRGREEKEIPVFSERENEFVQRQTQSVSVTQASPGGGYQKSVGHRG